MPNGFITKTAIRKPTCQALDVGYESYATPTNPLTGPEVCPPHGFPIALGLYVHDGAPTNLDLTVENGQWLRCRCASFSVVERMRQKHSLTTEALSCCQFEQRKRVVRFPFMIDRTRSVCSHPVMLVLPQLPRLANNRANPAQVLRGRVRPRFFNRFPSFLSSRHSASSKESLPRHHHEVCFASRHSFSRRIHLRCLRDLRGWYQDLGRGYR